MLYCKIKNIISYKIIDQAGGIIAARQQILHLWNF